MVDRIIPRPHPGGIQVPMPRSCEYVTYMAKEFEDTIQLKILGWELIPWDSM